MSCTDIILNERGKIRQMSADSQMRCLLYEQDICLSIGEDCLFQEYVAETLLKSISHFSNRIPQRERETVQPHDDILIIYRLLNSQKFIGIYRKMKSAFWRDVYSDSKDLHQKMIHIRCEGMPKNLENTTGNMSSCTVLL